MDFTDQVKFNFHAHVSEMGRRTHSAVIVEKRLDGLISFAVGGTTEELMVLHTYLGYRIVELMAAQCSSVAPTRPGPKPVS